MPHSPRISGFIHFSGNSSSSSWHDLQMQVCNVQRGSIYPLLCVAQTGLMENVWDSWQIFLLMRSSVLVPIQFLWDWRKSLWSLRGKNTFHVFHGYTHQRLFYLWLLLPFTPQLFWRFLFAKWQRIACFAYLKCLYICGLFTFSKPRQNSRFPIWEFSSSKMYTLSQKLLLHGRRLYPGAVCILSRSFTLPQQALCCQVTNVQSHIRYLVAKQLCQFEMWPVSRCLSWLQQLYSQPRV